jgi:hypothetical protein
MAMRSPAGFISAFFDPLKNPDAPTSPAATAGEESASVSFTAPANVGGSAITAYFAVSNPSQITGTAATSPVTVSGLSSSTSYTFNVWALNSYGPGVFSAATGGITPTPAPRGLFGAGTNSVDAYSSIISYITLSTTGNATSFGSLVSINANSAEACASTTRCVWGGSNSGDQIFYVTFATLGNTTSFGNFLGGNTRVQIGAANNATRGLFAFGQGDASFYDQVTYITIATTGNTVLFGTASPARRGNPSGVMSSTRAVFGGGEIDNGGGDFDLGTASMVYVTTATTGNATSFGSLSTATTGLGNGASNATRGLIKLGRSDGPAYAKTAMTQYITIATTGSAINFGNLSSSKMNTAGCSSTTRAVFGGGTSTVVTNAIDYFTISTTGNSATFGQLTSATNQAGSSSSANGGTQ